MALLLSRTGRSVTVACCARLVSKAVIGKVRECERVKQLLASFRITDQSCYIPGWSLDVRYSYSVDRQDDTLLLHVNASLDYLRRTAEYARTTYRGYDHTVQLLGLEVGLLSQNALGAHLLTKLGCPTLDQQLDQAWTFVQHLQACDLRLIRSLNRQELLALILLLVNLKVPPSVLITAIIVNVDLECARRVTLWSAETCLLTLDLWVAWLGHAATRRSFFGVLLREWPLVSRSHQYPPHYLVQLLYYVGLRKAAPRQLLVIIQSALEKNIILFTNADLAIVCQGYFKSRQRVTSPLILRTIAERLKKLLEEGSVDRYLLVDFLKVLRHARHEDPVLCEVFAKFLKADFFTALSLVDLIRCAHYAAFFANARFYDSELFCEFEKMASFALQSALKSADEVWPSDRLQKPCWKGGLNGHKTLQWIRMKDLARILWSLSEVMHLPANAVVIEEAIRYIALQWQKGRYGHFQLNLFVDCLHSLTIMGILPDDLDEWMMQLEKSESLMSQKSVQKMFVIRESMKIEQSTCWRPPGLGAVCSTEAMHHYENLGKICILMSEICSGSRVLYRCLPLLAHIPIPGLELCLDQQGNFSPIELSENKVQSGWSRVAVEVLEPSRCLHNSCQPVGLWRMKIRQLEKLGYRVVKIMPSHVSNLEEMPARCRHLWFKQHLLVNLGLNAS